MTLPPDFDNVEHLQDVARKLYNRQLREWFSDVNLSNLDIKLPRHTLLRALQHQEGDNLLLTVSRQLLGEFLIFQRWNQLAAMLGDSGLRHKVSRKTKPQVILWFAEDEDDVEAGYDRIAGRMSFRLMDETSRTMTKAKATALAQKVKTQFGTAGGRLWRKGKDMHAYTDWDLGYQLEILGRSEAEIKALITDVLNLRNHTPDWENLEITKNSAPMEAYPTIPPKDLILGESVKLPRRRPIATVRFQYALLKLAGKPQPICLFDRTGTYPEPLVT